jgi:hypothetical protein
MGLFGRQNRGCSTNPQAAAPNPARFRVLQEERVGRLWVAMLQYPNCSNFEGHKVVVCKGVAPSLRTSLDPHFSENGDIVARFAPTPAGFALARTCAHAY